MGLLIKMILYRLIFRHFDFKWFYRWYVRSKPWQKKRLQIIARQKGKCKRCGLSGRLEVHHLTYKRLGHERHYDLEALCPRCHKKYHRV